MKSLRLGEIASAKGLVGGPFGSSLVGQDYVDQGVPVIRGGNLGHGRLVGGEFVFVSAEKVARDLERNLARPGDLIITQRGTLGQVAIVPAVPFEQYVVSQSQMRLRVDPTVMSAEFLYYACSAPDFVKQLHANAISTGVPHINLGILSRLEVPDRDLREQTAVARVLGALDDKIAANAELAATADELALTMFRVISNDSYSRPLTESARFINGKAFTKNATGSGRVVVRIAELNSGIGPSTVYNDIDVHDDHRACAGDILFAWSGSLMLHRWARPEAIINQHIFKVIPNDGYPAWLVYELIRARLDGFKGIAADKATTMGHIQRRHLGEPVPVPARDKIAAHDGVMSALWDRRLAADQESILLAEVRDALLPHLMSGRLRVKDAEQIVSDRT